MGLIKTAIMTGGGIYAVKQLAAAQNNRHSSSSNSNQGPPQQQNRSQQQYYNNPPPQGYWGPPAPGQEHLGPVWYPYPPPSQREMGSQRAGSEERVLGGERTLGQRAIEGGNSGGKRVYRDEGLPVYERVGGKN